MLRQYHASRGHSTVLPSGRAVCVGPVQVGDTFYLQDARATPVVRRVPWRVEGWLPRERAAAACVVRPDGARHYENRFSAGGHLALIRSLRSGEVRTVAEQWLYAAYDASLEHHPRIARKTPGARHRRAAGLSAA